MVNTLINVENLERTNRSFGGNAGAKRGVILNEEEYIVKYPKNIKEMRKVEISYSTSPLSEYIGSHVYEFLGFPVHKTLLGYDKDKLVVLCKNFNLEGLFYDFKSIANNQTSTIIDEIDYTDGNSTDIFKVFNTIKKSELITNKEETFTRFWNMFVIDYLINNNDRNNTNWGYFIKPIGKSESLLAPIFDNGNSFYNKLSDNQMLERLNNKALFDDACVYGTTSCFMENDKHLNFTKAFKNKTYLDLGLNDAILRNVPNIANKMPLILEFIDEIPNDFNGLTVCSDIQKAFIKETLKARCNALESIFDSLSESTNK